MKKLIPFAACVALLFCGCAKKQVVKKPGPLLKIASEDDSFNSKSRAGAQKLSFSRDSALENARFDYDKSDLRQDTRQTLDKNTNYLKDKRVPAVRVEGHCDQRGTVEYNLALGQRRANAAKEYYEQLGVPQVEAISYGKEKPLCDQSNEDCWQLNRRAETLAGR